MEINATLFGQMITFGIFVWFTMKFVWPTLDATLLERRKKIADGLAAAEKGQKTLEMAGQEAQYAIDQAKAQGHDIIKHANQQAQQILEAARAQAHQERNDIVAAGKAEVEQEVHRAKSQLQEQVAQIVVKGAEKILARSINLDDHSNMLDNLAKEITK